MGRQARRVTASILVSTLLLSSCAMPGIEKKGLDKTAGTAAAGAAAGCGVGLAFFLVGCVPFAVAGGLYGALFGGGADIVEGFTEDELAEKLSDEDRVYFKRRLEDAETDEEREAVVDDLREYLAED